MKPVLLLTNYATPARVGAFETLHRSQGTVTALFGGRLHHGGEISDQLPFPHLYVKQREIYQLIRSGDYRAVVCGLGGRTALPSAYLAARQAKLPFVLWASLWAHPRSAAHTLSYLPLRHIYRHADAVVTYGSHVSRYVEGFGAKAVFEAPQAVDNDFWQVPTAAVRDPNSFKALFVGRLSKEKGLLNLLKVWQQLNLPNAELVTVGDGPLSSHPLLAQPTVNYRGRLPATELRELYGSSDILLLPSLKTATFREPWGLVINEGMNQAITAVASDQVGAVAGGLLKNRINGLVFTAGNDQQLAETVKAAYNDRAFTKELGENASQDIKKITFSAWSMGVTEGLRYVGADRQG